MDAAFGSVEGTSNSMSLFLARWLRSARTTPSPFKERTTASGPHNAFGRQRSESIVSPHEFPTSFHRMDSVDRAALLL